VATTKEARAQSPGLGDFNFQHASELARTMLNGNSSGSTDLWVPSPDDYLLGDVTLISDVQDRYSKELKKRISIHVHEGSERGQKLEHGSHVAILCRHAELIRMVEQTEPAVRDLLAVVYLGKPKNAHLYRYSLKKSEAASVSEF
jgi:hypothetical protein